jgi:hypothetical protein
MAKEDEHLRYTQFRQFPQNKLPMALSTNCLAGSSVLAMPHCIRAAAHSRATPLEDKRAVTGDWTAAGCQVEIGTCWSPG